MSLSSTNPVKVGLFVVIGALLGVGALIWVGATQFDRVVIPAVTFVDESVQGMDIGSEVKFRGVTIGSVTYLGVAPDEALLEIRFDVYQDVLERIGFEEEERMHDHWEEGQFAEPDLRVQLQSAGITGLKFLNLGRVDEAESPPRELPFMAPWNYVPSVPSTLKSVEDAIVQAAESLPRLLEQVEEVVNYAEMIAHEVDVVELAGRLRSLLATVQEKLDALDVDAIGADVEQGVAESREAMITLNAFLNDLRDPERPALKLLTTSEAAIAATDVPATAAALRESSRAFTDLARNADDMSDEMRAGLIELRDALAAIRNLAALLERNPEALLSGKAEQDTSPGSSP